MNSNRIMVIALLVGACVIGASQAWFGKKVCTALDKKGCMECCTKNNKSEQEVRKCLADCPAFENSSDQDNLS